ncbi:ribonucleotide reductase N-terminal alpha domain-containing protein [Glutamicibacter protophormiae]|uniref:ribonucleotide reductase N-terminal alpha domain-containing protein n=1 Tax=Glutamicibacter protophormiae TaxID=37930 RepID=UPI0036063A92
MKDTKELPAQFQGLSYNDLNAMLNLYGPDGKIQFEVDRYAARQYFLDHVNNNTVFFHDLDEKLEYLVKHEYYERETLDQYSMNFIRDLFKHAFSKKFRFETFLGAFKFYTSYTLKTFDGKRYLERYEDRVCMVALHLARVTKNWPPSSSMKSSKAASSRPPRPSSTPARHSVENWSPASCFASKTTWSRLPVR